MQTGGRELDRQRDNPMAGEDFANNLGLRTFI